LKWILNTILIAESLCVIEKYILQYNIKFPMTFSDKDQMVVKHMFH